MQSPCALQNVSGTSIYFLSKLCSGSPGDSFPLGYLSTPTPLFDGGQTLTLRSTALAYFDTVAPAAPINQFTLDALATQFQADFLSWQENSVDQTYLGVVALAPVPIYDEIIIDYFDNGVCKTRAIAPPVIGWPRELGHADYFTTSGGNNCYDQPYSFPPCAVMYGPPATSGTSTVLNKYMVCLQDGRIASDYMGQDTFDCGCTQGCSVLICVTGCPSGSPLSGATVEIQSGGKTIASGTTVSPGGCIGLAIPAAGSYTVVVSATGYNGYTGTLDLQCNGTVTIALQPNTVQDTLSFTVLGCCGMALPGATVTLSDGQSATTDVNGQCSFSVGMGGTITYTASYPPRFVPYTGSISLPACAYQKPGITIQLNAANGYYCGFNGPYPTLPTVDLSDVVYGATTLNYTASITFPDGTVGPGYTGSISGCQFPAVGGCPASTGFTITYLLSSTQNANSCLPTLYGAYTCTFCGTCANNIFTWNNSLVPSDVAGPCVCVTPPGGGNTTSSSQNCATCGTTGEPCFNYESCTWTANANSFSINGTGAQPALDLTATFPSGAGTLCAPPANPGTTCPCAIWTNYGPGTITLTEA